MLISANMVWENTEDISSTFTVREQVTSPNTNFERHVKPRAHCEKSGVA
jgi:hypothetical protein